MEIRWVWLKKARAFQSLDRNILASVLWTPHQKSDKNPDLTIKNSSLYKLELTVTLPKNISLRS